MRLGIRIVQIMALVVFVTAWGFVSYFNFISQYVLPSPYSVGLTFIQMLASKGFTYIPNGIYPQLAATLTEVAGAMGLATAIGLALGFAIGMKRVISAIYEPIVYLLYSIPGIVLYPVIYLLVGVGEPSKILFGAFLGTWVLAINTIAGLRQIKPQYFRLSKSLKLSSWNTMSKVVLPAAAPHVISGLRLALALSIIGVVAGEILASNKGVGYVITAASNTFDMPLMYAAILLVFIIGFGLVEIMRILERRFLSHAN